MKFEKKKNGKSEIQKNSKRTSNSDIKLHGCKEGATKCGVEKMEKIKRFNHKQNKHEIKKQHHR